MVLRPGSATTPFSWRPIPQTHIMLRRAWRRGYSTGTLPRFAVRLKWLAQARRVRESQQQLANLRDSFARHHEAMKEILKDDSNVKALFGEYLESEHPEFEGCDGRLSFGADISKTLEMLIAWLTHTMVVDLNVQAMIAGQRADSGLYRDIMTHLQRPELRRALKSALQVAIDSRDTKTQDRIFTELALNPNFNTLEVYRTYFMHIKSRQAHTYPESDYRSQSGSGFGLTFSQSEVNNCEYEDAFDVAFAAHYRRVERENLMRESDPHYSTYVAQPTEENFVALNEIYQAYVTKNPPNLQHLRLLADIITALVQCRRYTPDYEVVTLLIKRFEDAGMGNYASMGFQSLFRYEDNASVLAVPTLSQPEPRGEEHEEISLEKPVPSRVWAAVTGQNIRDNLSAALETTAFVYASLTAKHFEHVIRESPNTLGPLAVFCAKHGQLSTLAQLLSYCGLDEIMDHEKVLGRLYLNPVLAKLWFLRHPKLRRLNMDSILYDLNKPILVKHSTIHALIEACIISRQFGLVDSLFNKMVMHATAGQQVALAFGEGHELERELLLTKKLSVPQLSAEFFSKPLLKLMIKVSIDSNDLGRLMWLMPHLDDYIARALAGSRVGTAVKSDGALDYELIAIIRDALTQFGLEGKLNQYQQLIRQLLVHSDA